jgi:hypothetical protein
MKNTIINKHLPNPASFNVSDIEDRDIAQLTISSQTHSVSVARKIKIYLFVLLILFLTGCSTVYVPALNTKIAIENSDGDCKDKAIAYQTVLQDQGIESCVTCGVLSSYSKPLLHCWNEVLSPEDDRWKLVDADAVERRVDGWDTEQSPEYMPYVRYSGKVTLDDIRSERGFYWKSEKSLAYIMENCQFNWIPIISEIDYMCIFSPPEPQNFPRPPSNTNFAGL